ncbi:MAG: hypothetical protein ACON30_02995, partial [Flavobacteriaceae bacterium]
MKKITFYFLFLISMLQIHAQSNVTFSVDMSGQTGFTTVYVSGSLNGWSGDANPLTDTDGDGVWETTLSIADGSYEYKFTLDNWSGQENLSQGLVGTTTNDCDNGALCTNRTLTVSGADKVLDTVPFQGTNINAGPYSVTFNVDMSSYTGTFGSVNINGENYNNQGLGNWCGGCITLTDDDGDNIYSATIQLEAYTYSFKFTVDGWTDQEIFSSGDAGTQTISGNVNRLISVDNDMIVSAVWDDPASLSVTSTTPATAAPIPTEQESDVVSVYSDSYTDVAVSSYNTVWSDASMEDITIGGNATKRYTNLVFNGIETTLDASGMSHFSIDIWSHDATLFKVKLVDWLGNGYGNGDTEAELVFDGTEAPAQGEWVSYNISLSDFATAGMT